MSRLSGTLHTFFCAQCEQVAATIHLLPAEPAEPEVSLDSTSAEERLDLAHQSSAWLRLDWRAGMEAPANETTAGLLRRTSVDPLDLSAQDPDLGGFCCKRCVLNYCGPCWRAWTEFDTDGSGWAQGVRGVCPNAHNQLLQR